VAPLEEDDEDDDESSDDGDRHGKDHGGHEKAQGNGHTKEDKDEDD
jgi:hypothetical protein